jgi:Mn-containing catalase
MYLHVQRQYSFNLDDLSEAGRIFQGVSPSGDGSILTAGEQMPQGVPMTIASERMEEFSPGLDTDLMALLQAAAEMEMEEVQKFFGPVSPEGQAPAPGNDGTGLVDKVKNIVS